MALEGTNDATSVEHLRALNRRLVLERLAQHRLTRITLDFEGSVLSTQRHAEGIAVGYNNKKGQRSYYSPVRHHRPDSPSLRPTPPPPQRA